MFLLIEGSNYVDFPVGGQLTFSKQLMKAFAGEVALVGVTTDAGPVGKWVEKDFGVTRHWFFAVARRDPSVIKPLLPARLRFMAELLRHRKRILQLGTGKVLLQSPEALMATYKWGWDSICYRFSGMVNPWYGSRYRGASCIGPIADRCFFKALKSAEVMLAAADSDAIDAFTTRWRKHLPNKKITAFPSYLDTEIFFPVEKAEASFLLGLSPRRRRVACCGRLNHVKGWDLVLRGFRIFAQREKDAELVFVGGGEDHARVLAAAVELGLGSCVRVTGFQPPRIVSLYLNASDVIVFGSHWEGWCSAMLEALACGKPIVTTAVSGSAQMVRPGENGFVVKSRDPEDFALAMARAAELPRAARVSRKIAREYDVKFLRDRLVQAWPSLAQ